MVSDAQWTLAIMVTSFAPLVSIIQRFQTPNTRLLFHKKDSKCTIPLALFAKRELLEHVIAHVPKTSLDAYSHLHKS